MDDFTPLNLFGNVDADNAVESGEATEEKTTDSKETVEEEPQPDKLDKVLESQQQLLEQLEDLNALFNARIMHTEHEEKIVDQMHKELQKYKEGGGI